MASAVFRSLLAGLAWLAGGLILVFPAHAAPSGGIPGSPTSLGEAVSPSDARQLALVEHLRQMGAVFYGAWWCPHCFEQKNLFGTEAGRRLPYVECDKTDAGRQRCQAAGIRAYPTWEINGKRFEGVQSLSELEQLSGYVPAVPRSGTPAASKP